MASGASLAHGRGSRPGGHADRVRSKRFTSARKAVRFTGLDITVYSSAGRRSPGRLSRQGLAILRWCLTSRAQLVVNTAYVLMVMAAGVLGMTHGTVQVRHRVADLAPRLVIGFGLSSFAVSICQWIIAGANTLVVALTGDGIASPGAPDALLRVVTDALTNPVSRLLVAALGLIILVLMATLLLTRIARLVALIVLCGVAPIALACHGLPFTDPLAQLWWRSMGGVVAIVVLQAVALDTGLAILLDPSANLPDQGLPADPTGLFNLFIVVCLLWVTVRIPGLVRRYVTGGGGQRSTVGTIVRVVLVHQLTRGAGTLLRGAGRPMAATPRRLPPDGGSGGAAGAAGSGGRGPTRSSGPRPSASSAGRGSPARPIGVVPRPGASGGRRGASGPAAPAVLPASRSTTSEARPDLSAPGATAVGSAAGITPSSDHRQRAPLARGGASIHGRDGEGRWTT